MCSWAYHLETVLVNILLASFSCVEGFGSASGEHVGPSSLSGPRLSHAQSGTKFGLEVTFHKKGDTWIFMDMGCTSEYTERINALASLLLRGCRGWETKCLHGSWWQPGVPSSSAAVNTGSPLLTSCGCTITQNWQLQSIVLLTELSCHGLGRSTTGPSLARVQRLIWLEGLLPELCAAGTVHREGHTEHVEQKSDNRKIFWISVAD